MTSRKDACFYVNETGSEIVWESKDCDFYVIRCGEMRVVLGDDIIRYSDNLIHAGITDDSQLIDIETINNPWFEIWKKSDSYWCSDPIFDIDEAIDYAQNFAPIEFGKDN